MTIRRGWQCWKLQDRFLSPLALGFTAAIIGHMIHMYVDLFNGRPQVQLLWLIAGLVDALGRMEKVPHAALAEGVGASARHIEGNRAGHRALRRAVQHPKATQSHPQVTMGVIEQVIARFGARHIADTRALGAELRRRLESAEREPDTPETHNRDGR